MTSNPPPSRREREQARHRREILAAALRQFADNGYHETTMQMIADAAEFSVGYLYKHFAGKEDMYRALLTYHIEKLDAIEAQNSLESLAPLEQLRRSFENVCDHFNNHRDFMRIYHQGIDPSTSGLAQRKKKHFARMVGLFQAAIDRGELRPVDPRLLAAAVQGASHGLFRELAQRDLEKPFEKLPEILFTLLIDGLRPT